MTRWPANDRTVDESRAITIATKRHDRRRRGRGLHQAKDEAQAGQIVTPYNGGR